MPEILKLLPSVSVSILLPLLSFTKNLPLLSFPIVYFISLAVASFGSFIVTVSLSPLTAFLGSFIVTVVLLISPSLPLFLVLACSLLILLAPLASSNLTSGFFTYSKLAETSGSFISVCLSGFMFVILALIVVSCPCLRSNPGTLNEY